MSSRSKMMGAGCASSFRKVNVNLNSGGGSKKQGITSRVGLAPLSNRPIQRYSNGIGRTTMHDVNQLGGVGRHNSMFLSPGAPKLPTLQTALRAIHNNSDVITEREFISVIIHRHDFVPYTTKLSKQEVLSKMYKYLVRFTDGVSLYKSRLHTLPMKPMGSPASKCDTRCTNDPNSNHKNDRSGVACGCSYVMSTCICPGFCEQQTNGTVTCQTDEPPYTTG